FYNDHTHPEYSTSGYLTVFGIQAWNIQGVYGRCRNVRRSGGPDRFSFHGTKMADEHRPWRTRLLLDLAVDLRPEIPEHPHADLHRHSPSAAGTRRPDRPVPV